MSRRDHSAKTPNVEIVKLTVASRTLSVVNQSTFSRGWLKEFSDFTLEQVVHALGVSTQEIALFPKATEVQIPLWLVETLNRRTQLALISEKARSDFIVVPILLASRELSPSPHDSQKSN